jgi:hypothetical protein
LNVSQQEENADMRCLSDLSAAGVQFSPFTCSPSAGERTAETGLQVV